MQREVSQENIKIGFSAYLWCTGFHLELKIHTVSHVAAVKSLCKCNFPLHDKGFL